MSYHDTRLHGRTCKATKAKAFKRGLAKGAFSLTLFPKGSTFRLGSQVDDWSNVGEDIRTSMKRLETCD